MQEIKNQIRELLSKNVFLKQELKDRVWVSTDKLGESALLELRDMLQHGVGLTKEAINDSAKADVNFLVKVKTVSRKVGSEKIEKAENVSRASEEAILDELEDELANI